ncbi:MAG: aminoacyl-tRNA hydrolase, partial [Hyphomicrobiaceae bacterium]
QVAQALNDFRDSFGDDDDAERKPAKAKKPAAKTDEEAANKAAAKKPPARHPSGERGSKRQSALADNLKRWLAGRANKDN